MTYSFLCMEAVSYTHLYMVRASHKETKDRVAEKVLNCFKAGALATGCKMEVEPGSSYADRIVNMTISRYVQANLRQLGRGVKDEPVPVRGSTDFGDVSQVVPAVNTYISIASENVASHSNEMREAAPVSYTHLDVYKRQVQYAPR